MSASQPEQPGSQPRSHLLMRNLVIAIICGILLLVAAAAMLGVRRPSELSGALARASKDSLYAVGAVYFLLGGLGGVGVAIALIIGGIRHRPIAWRVPSLVLLVMIFGAGVWVIEYASTRRAGPGSGFDVRSATAIAHIALPDPTSLPGIGWSVTAVDRFTSTEPHDPGAACTTMRAATRELHGKYDTLVAGRAKVEFWRAAAAKNAIDTTVEIELQVFQRADEATGFVDSQHLLESRDAYGQCLVDDTGLPLTWGETLAPVPPGGYALAARITPPPAVGVEDVRVEHYMWPHENVAVSVTVSGTAMAVDAPLVQAAVASTIDAVAIAERAGAPGPGSTMRYPLGLSRSLGLTQEALVTLDASRRQGDDITAHREGGSLDEVKQSVDGALTIVKEAARFEETRQFSDGVVAWGNALSAAAGGGAAAWVSRPAAPSLAAITISAAQRQEIVESTVQRIAATAGSVPMIAARRQPEAGRFALARFAAQRLVLQQLAPAGNDDVCVRSGCLRTVLPLTIQLEAAAATLLQGSSNEAGAEWNKVWSAAELAIRPGGYRMLEAGLSAGASDTPPISAGVKLYTDTCRTGGGLVDDTGGVRVLPTTEGGWTCWSKDKTCWHHYTYSGALYTFGGSGQGCPDVAAVAARAGGVQIAAPGAARAAAYVPPPPPAEPLAAPPAPAPAPPVQSPVAPLVPPIPEPARGQAFTGLDGIYRLRIGDVACSDGRVFDRRQTLGFLGIPDTNSPTLTVRERRLLGVVPSAAIDADGLVVAAGSIGTNIRTTDRLRFSSRGDSAGFTAEHTRQYAADQVSCHLVYEGERVAP